MSDVPYPVWSPDGTKIAFQWGGALDIYVMNADEQRTAEGGRETHGSSTVVT